MRRGWLGGGGGRRGALEFGIVVVVAALAVGAALGSGLAQMSLETLDPLTWLRNLRGEVSQVNPEAGTPVSRLPVGLPGDDLQVIQGDGVLVVINLRTNTIITIDTSMLRIGGTRPGGDRPAQVLLTLGQVYVADLGGGVIERIDPLSAAPIGAPWRSDGPLVSTTADASGSVWALGEGGELTGLRWSPEPATLVPSQQREIDGVGTDAVLAPHQQGVTVLDPSGNGAQVGTGQDRALRADALAPPLLAALQSPPGLVSFSSPDTSTVQLIRPGGSVDVDTGVLGCDAPGRSAVYAGRIYLPCAGDRKVLVLGPDGRPAGEPLATDGDPELVLNAGLLMVNVLGSEYGYVVRPDGTVQRIRTHDPALPVPDPASTMTVVPSQFLPQPPAPSSRRPEEPNPSPSTNLGNSPSASASTNVGNSPSASASGSTTPSASASPSIGVSGSPSTSASPSIGVSGSPSTSPSASPSASPSTSATPDPTSYTPTGVTATVPGPGAVQVQWTPPPNPPSQGYEILRVDTGSLVAQAPPGGTFSIVGGLPPGTYEFVVVAVDSTGRYPSAASNQITTYGLPSPPQVSAQLAARSPTTFQLNVFVSVQDDGGTPVNSYDISAQYTSGNGDSKSITGIPIGQSPWLLTMDCRGIADPCLSGGSVDITVTLTSAAGTGPPTTISQPVAAPPAWSRDTWVLLVTTGLKCLDADLRIHPCNQSAGMYWQHRSTGDIRNQLNGQCLAANDGLHFASDGCSEADKRWQPRNGERVNANQVFQNEGTQRCLFVNGDPAADGTQVIDRNCSFNTDNERFYVFTTTDPFTMLRSFSVSDAATADSGGSGGDGPIGAPLAIVLLAPILLGLVRLRGRRGVRR